MTVTEIRKRTGLSQAKFAKLYHIPKSSLENWEQNKRKAPPYLIELLERVVTYDSILTERFKNTQAYPAILTYEDGQKIAVEFPDLGVATSGTDDADALLSARECLWVCLCGLEEDGEDIPSPTPLSELKTAKNEKTILIDVFIPSIRMANETKAAKASKSKGLNFSQVLQEA